jgi:aryl-alcohol dehydrogenase-like predicted oxidoreductase
MSGRGEHAFHADGEAVGEAVERGITHIDTSNYYGPHIVNELIREAIHSRRPSGLDSRRY